MPDDADSCAHPAGVPMARAIRIRIPSLLPSIESLLSRTFYDPVAGRSNQFPRKFVVLLCETTRTAAPLEKIVSYESGGRLQSRTVSLSKTIETKMSPSRDPYLVKAVVHASRVLSAFRLSGEALPLREVSARSGLPKSMTFRLLYTLERCGMVEKVG